MRAVLLFLGFAVALASGCNTPVPGVDSGAMDSATDDSAMAPAVGARDAVLASWDASQSLRLRSTRIPTAGSRAWPTESQRVAT